LKKSKVKRQKAKVKKAEAVAKRGEDRKKFFARSASSLLPFAFLLLPLYHLRRSVRLRASPATHGEKKTSLQV
jgi:hypothetical protein